MQERRLNLRLGAGSCHGSNSLLASSALDAGGFAPQVAQIVQPCPANFTLANHLDRADGGRMEWEDAFDAYAKTDPAYRKRGTGRAALLGDHHAFECLQALLDLFAFAFLQADVDAHGVARATLGEVFAQLRFM